jgi:hypothetical protein
MPNCGTSTASIAPILSGMGLAPANVSSRFFHASFPVVFSQAKRVEPDRKIT